MRRRGKSPWLIAAQNPIASVNPEEIAKAIAGGAHPICAWRSHHALTIMQLAKLTKIPGYRLMSLEDGAKPYPDETNALSRALKIAPELLSPACAIAGRPDRSA